MVLDTDDVRWGLTLPSAPSCYENYFAILLTCSSKVRPLSRGTPRYLFVDTYFTVLFPILMVELGARANLW